MYDKIKLKLCAWALPSNYRWQDVVARLALSQYRGDDTGGSGKWRGRKVIATETYVSLRAVFLNAYGGIIHVLCH